MEYSDFFDLAFHSKMVKQTSLETVARVLTLRRLHFGYGKIVEKLCDAGIRISRCNVNRIIKKNQSESEGNATNVGKLG